LRVRGYRFYFFSREENRIHVHVICPDGEAKFWIEPEIELARNYGLNRLQLKEIEGIIEEHCDEFKEAWNKRSGS
jgi:hypothetical protein